jgi:hypothetical protein
MHGLGIRGVLIEVEFNALGLRHSMVESRGFHGG